MTCNTLVIEIYLQSLSFGRIRIIANPKHGDQDKGMVTKSILINV